MPPEINPSERLGDSATRRMAARVRAVAETSVEEGGSADTGSRERALRLVARPLWIVAVCALVIVLRVGREVLIPLVAAVLLGLVLSGVVETLRRYRIPRGLSAGILLLLGVFAAGLAIDALWTPATQWLQDAPRILRSIEHKVRPARSAVLRLNEIATRASAIANPGSEARPGTPSAAAPAAPANTVSAMEVLAGTGWALGTTVTILALTLLLLATGPPTLARMTAALASDLHAVHVLRIIDAIRVEMGRYYGTLVLINLSLGVATALTMWLLGMPNPVLWGAMATVLNFIPYLGSATTLTILTIVAFGTFDSIAHVLLVSACYLGLATVEGQIVEPVFFGRRLRLNPIIVFVAIWLGGWLWGIAGVIFAVPLLVVVKVAAAHASPDGMFVRFLDPSARSNEEARAEPESARALPPREFPH
jgi:predicted PurR-regulated permease PerM